MTSGSYWSSQQHASVITLKNRQQRPLTRLCYENRRQTHHTVIPAEAGIQGGGGRVTLSSFGTNS